MAIAMYSTPSCSYCRMAKQYFKENRIPFREFDVSRDERRAEEMYKKSGQMGVPVIDVNGQILVGFDKARLERALKR